jgi:hypothetical protein
MGSRFRSSLFVAGMAGIASHFQMRVLTDQLLIDQIPFVILFRLNWRRRSRSPFAL